LALRKISGLWASGGALVLRKGIVALLLASALVAWGQVHQRTRTADISGSEMVFRWSKNEFEFSGNCVLTVQGPTTAILQAPRMVFQLDRSGGSFKSLKAFGPVQLSLTTAPDAENVRRKIVARCSQYATFAEGEQVIELVGDAVADMITLPETPEAPRAHFNGDYVRANLSTGELSAKPARLRIEGVAETTARGEKK
jgi:lipopolysaccharide export system protein LptA